VDHVKQFADGIVSLSLGSPVVMDFESTSNAKERKSGKLPRRSLLSMHGTARYKYRHGIQKRTSDPGIPGKRGTRISLTFRKIK
jgi:alkylated DNA repair dioxygenase AlkB